MRQSRLACTLGLLSLLAACQAPPQIRLAHAQPFALQPQARPVARPPDRTQPRWAFSVAQDKCRATLAYGDVTVSVEAGPARAISLSVAPSSRSAQAGRPASVAFAGAGSWRIPARDTGRSVEASFPAGAEGLDHLLALLGGGRLSVSTGTAALPDRRVPDAGVAGRDWYGCAARLAAEPG